MKNVRVLVYLYGRGLSDWGRGLSDHCTQTQLYPVNPESSFYGAAFSPLDGAGADAALLAAG